ncbi:MAG: hypothetical protein LC781_09275 [Actinobacteria bacterium]|nr:hypothetical protein [Actinomycetota bacterium]
MASQLYRTTQPLAAQVALVLDRLGISGVGSPITAALIGLLYVSGLILLDVRQTQTRSLAEVHFPNPLHAWRAHLRATA